MCGVVASLLFFVLSRFYPAHTHTHTHMLDVCVELFVPDINLLLLASVSLPFMGDRNFLFASFYSHTYLYVIESVDTTTHRETQRHAQRCVTFRLYFQDDIAPLSCHVFCMCSSGSACICSEPCVCL